MMCRSMAAYLIFVLAAYAGGAGTFATAPISAMPEPGDPYVPVAPPRSLATAMRVNLRVGLSWLDEGDFDSAAESVERVAILLDLCRNYSDDRAWRTRLAETQAHCDAMVEAAQKKDADSYRAAHNRCLLATAELDRSEPPPRSAPTLDPKPSVPLRSIMKLLDATYSDARLARSFEEFANLTLTIAETANVVQFLREDETWREHAERARDEAVRVANLKTDTDLKVARQELKIVYSQCQACHNAFNKQAGSN